MGETAKVYVAGHNGLVGRAVVKALEAAGWGELVLRTHQELELTDQAAVAEFFATQRPTHVVLAAAKVGGILANDTQPAQFIQVNLAIQQHVIHQAWLHGVQRLLFLGSSCIYPRDCPQPIREEYLLTGPLEPTNRAYAVAKIAGVEMCAAYHRQYGARFLALMPTNLYGPGDNYDLNSSHVLPALIRKMHQAKVNAAPTVTAWGTGNPLREFLYSEDLGRACLHLLRAPVADWDRAYAWGYPPLINVGTGRDLSIRELTELVREVVGYTGRVVWDPTKPDGTPRKLLDVSRLESLGWRPQVELREGVALAYGDFLASLERGVQRAGA